MNGSHQNQLSSKVTRYHMDDQDSIPRRARDCEQVHPISYPVRLYSVASYFHDACIIWFLMSLNFISLY